MKSIFCYGYFKITAKKKHNLCVFLIGYITFKMSNRKIFNKPGFVVMQKPLN